MRTLPFILPLLATTGLAWFTATAQAETLGPIYAIIEADMVVQIQDELRAKERTGELAKLEEEAIRRSEGHARHPVTGESPSRTGIPRTFWFDPTVVVNRDIRTPAGALIAAAGTRFNPLDQVSLPQPMLFFDASDPAQRRAARRLLDGRLANAKPILTGGDYVEVQRDWQRQVFVDQAGVLIRRFGIRQVPASITQEGHQLRIDEIALKDIPR